MPKYVIDLRRAPKPVSPTKSAPLRSQSRTVWKKPPFVGGDLWSTNGSASAAEDGGEGGRNAAVLDDEVLRHVGVGSRT